MKGRTSTGWHNAPNAEVITNFKIFSSKEGINWFEVFSKETLVKRKCAFGQFPIEAFNGKLYVGLVDSEQKGDFLVQESNLYVADFTLTSPAEPICYGCSNCRNIGDSCSTECGDCPSLSGCLPGMDCTRCYPGYLYCKYWTCKNNMCGINQW